MEKSLFTRLIPLTLLGMACHAFAENSVIYRWVDTNNVAHFSQHQPEHDNFTTLEIGNKSKSSVATNDNIPKNPVTKAIDSINKAEEKTAIENTINKRCEEARSNIRTLMAFDNVQYIDSEGKAKVLTESEKNQQLALSEKQVEVYCKTETNAEE